MQTYHGRTHGHKERDEYAGILPMKYAASPRLREDQKIAEFNSPSEKPK